MRSSCRAALRFHLVVAYTTAVLALTLPGPAHAQTVQLCSGGSGPPVCDGSCPVDQECVWDGGGVCLCFGLCQPLVQGPPVCDGTCPPGTVCDDYVGCHCMPACESLSVSVCAVSGGQGGGCPYPLVCQYSGGVCQCATQMATPTPTVTPRPSCTPGFPDCSFCPPEAACQCDPACGCSCLPATPSVTPTVTVTPTPPVDHFTCYKAGATSGSNEFPGIPIPPGVALTDQFGSSIVAVKKPKFLCAPTNKMGEDPTAPLDPEHLKGYQIKNLAVPTFLPKTVDVTDQFNPVGLFVDAKKQSHLLVPTVKDRLTPPPLPGAFTVDHFQCYKVAASKSAPKFVPVLNVEIEDQFGIMHVDVKKPTFLCNPVDKNGEDPSAPSHVDRLMCYQVKQVKTEPQFQKVFGVFVNNQFGPEQLDVKKPSELCVPALSTARFVDGGNGTVTDKLTGLQWEKKTDDGGVHDKDNSYTWTDTSDVDYTDPDGTAFTVFLATLNASPCFAGHCDWRLPTVNRDGDPAELETILDLTQGLCGVGTGACIDPIFGPTASYFYWSATTLARDPGPKYAWNVYFLSGYVNNSFKSWADPVRAVRSGP